MLRCQRCSVVVDDCDTCSEHGDDALVTMIQGPAVIDGTYHLRRVLASGGMGLVAEAEHLGLKRRVAIKLIRPDKELSFEAQMAFRREAETLGRFDHPSIVRVSDFGIDDRGGGTPYLVMELVSGRSLRQYLQDGVPDLNSVLDILQSVAEGLDEVHAAGIQHRDLKPENILLPDDGRPALLVDFGLALSAIGIEGHEVQDGRLVGTPGYIAPELTDGFRHSPAADLYGFAVVAFELIVGRRPFKGHPVELLAAAYKEAPAASSISARVPREMDAVLRAALSCDPARRPASAIELVQRLRSAELAARQRLWTSRERPRRLRMALVLAVAVWGVCQFPFVSRLWASIDEQLHEVHLALAPDREPDPRLLLLSIDDVTLDVDETPIVDRAHEMGIVLDALLEAGATAVAVDVLLPAQWGAERAFSDTLVKHHERIVLALLSTADGGMVGAECVQGPTTLVLGAKRAEQLFGLVNVEPSASGALHRFRRAFRNSRGVAVPSFSQQVTTIIRPQEEIPSLAPVWIDYRIAVDRLERQSWVRVKSELEQNPNQYRNRIILLGQEFAGCGDVFSGLPSRPRARLSGLELQALQVSTLLEDAPLVPLLTPSSAGLASLVAAAIAGILVLASRRPTVSCALIIVASAAFVLAASVLFVLGGWIVFGSSIIMTASFVGAVAWVLALRFEPFPTEDPRSLV